MVSQSSKSILIVDDQPLSTLDHLRILQKHGFRVYLAHRAKDAIEQLQYGNIGLVLMDMDLQGSLDGDELAGKLLSIKSVPIIFLTYHKEQFYTEKAGKVTNYGYLSKDVSEGMLIETVNMALLLSEDRRQVEEWGNAIKESEELLAKTQKLAHIGSWSLDLEKELLHWSSEVYRIFGLQPQEQKATYRSFLDAIHPEDRQKVDEAYLESIQQKRDGYEIEHRIIRRDTGEVRFVYEKCEHLRNRDGEIVQSLGMIQDVTEHKELEKLKEEVDRIIWHDIRSPLNGLIGIPQILIADETISDAQREYLQMIVDSGRSMLDIINLSLTIVNIERRSHHHVKEHFDLLKLIRQCRTDSNTLIRRKNIELVETFKGCDSEEPDAVAVAGEKLLAYSVISNILRNALEASPPGEVVEIELVCYDSEILVSFHNQGTVPKEIRDTFFQKYTTSGKEGGIGIGTYSAKILSEAQGWDIAMESSEEDGTIIRLTIPAE